jgi:hypothetical protein
MSEPMGADELIGYLNRYLAAAVITKAEDDQLTSAGVGNGPLDQTDPDPWARYHGWAEPRHVQGGEVMFRPAPCEARHSRLPQQTSY